MARRAKSLATLLASIDAAAPNRNKASDGWIADENHSASSDHQPNAAGVVTAIDITHDLAHGVDARKIAEQIVASRDNRWEYLISNGQIVHSRKEPGVWRPYTGPSAHREHVHISVHNEEALYDDPRPWLLTLAPPTVTLAMRLRMAKAIVDFEAQRDSAGRIKVYAPPSNDGGGAYEVAGINVRFHPAKAAQLKKLIDEGRHAEAEVAAGDYVLEYTNPVTAWHGDPGVEFYLRDCCFNRGPKGAARILQRAVGVEDDGIVGVITRGAVAKVTATQLLNSLRAAREDYERNVVGYRANFWNGLVNRWDKAMTVARQFSAEKPMTDTPLPPQDQPQVNVDLSKLLQSLEQWGPILAVIMKFLTRQDQPLALPKPVEAAVQPPPAPVVATPPPTPFLERPSAQIGLAGLVSYAIAAITGGAAPPLGENATTISQLWPTIAAATTVLGPGASMVGNLIGMAFKFFSNVQINQPKQP